MEGERERKRREKEESEKISGWERDKGERKSVMVIATQFQKLLQLGNFISSSISLCLPLTAPISPCPYPSLPLVLTSARVLLDSTRSHLPIIVRTDAK